VLITSDYEAGDADFDQFALNTFRVD